jgi:uncharacterized membrane protein
MITDQQVEQSIGILLRVGVMLSAAVVLFGGILYLAHRGGLHADYHVFHGEPQNLTTPSMTIHDVFTGSPEAIIELGLLLLILTPIARVVFSVVAFARERDIMYVVMTLIVLGVLLYSLLAA